MRKLLQEAEDESVSLSQNADNIALRNLHRAEVSASPGSGAGPEDSEALPGCLVFLTDLMN